MRQATPRIGDEVLTPEPFLSFTSGYVTRAMERFPKQGSKKPWKLYQNYAKDVVSLRFGSVDDGMEFSNAVPREQPAQRAHEAVTA